MSQKAPKTNTLILKLFFNFAELSLQKNCDVVTIADITKKTGIHRSTFYRHLESKQDLLELGTHIFWDGVRDQFIEYRKKENVEKHDLSKFNTPPPYLNYFFSLVLEHRTIFRAFLSANNSSYFLLESRKRINSFIQYMRLSLVLNLENNQALSGYITSCLITTLEIIVSNNSLDIVSDYYNFITRGVSGFTQQASH